MFDPYWMWSLGQGPLVKWFYPKGGDRKWDTELKSSFCHQPKVFHWARIGRTAFAHIFSKWFTAAFSCLPSLHTEAMWPMAPHADGGDCYSTGSIPGQQRKPANLNNLWQLPGVKISSKQLNEKCRFGYLCFPSNWIGTSDFNFLTYSK